MGGLPSEDVDVVFHSSPATQSKPTTTAKAKKAQQRERETRRRSESRDAAPASNLAALQIADAFLKSPLGDAFQPAAFSSSAPQRVLDMPSDDDLDNDGSQARRASPAWLEAVASTPPLTTPEHIGNRTGGRIVGSNAPRGGWAITVDMSDRGGGGKDFRRHERGAPPGFSVNLNADETSNATREAWNIPVLETLAGRLAGLEEVLGQTSTRSLTGRGLQAAGEDVASLRAASVASTPSEGLAL